MTKQTAREHLGPACRQRSAYSRTKVPGGRLTLLPFIARAIVLACADYPSMNSTYEAETGTLHQHGALHLGLATQTERGLVVPVIRDADQLSLTAGLTITVCHYPPGTSKWNKIEHRKFSFITINWRGRPLTSLRTVIELISATTTSTGLTVQAAYDSEWYAKGVKISDADLAAVPLTPHDFHGEWDYTINAQSDLS